MKGRRTSTIPKEEIVTLQAEFIGLDKDGNGEISVQELEQLLRSMRIKLRLSETEIRKALKIIDTKYMKKKVLSKAFKQRIKQIFFLISIFKVLIFNNSQLFSILRFKFKAIFLRLFGFLTFK